MAEKHKVTDHVRFRAVLDATPVQQVQFNIVLLEIDDPAIPIHMRVRTITQSGYKEQLEAGTLLYDYANTLFTQENPIEELILGRLVSSTSSAYFVVGPGYEKDSEIWADETTGYFTVSVPGGSSDEVGPCDFSSVTAFDQIPAVLTAATQAAASDIPELATAVWSIDALGYLTLTMPPAGPSVIIEDGVTGNNIAQTLLDADNGTQQASVTAETLTEAYIKIQALNDDFFQVHFRGGADDNERIAFAQTVQGDPKVLTLWSSDAEVIDPNDDTDIFTLIKDLNLNQTFNLYFDADPGATTWHPDAAVDGAVLNSKPGTHSWAHNRLTNIVGSAWPYKLSADALGALESKNGNSIKPFKDATVCYSGVMSTGVEKRLIAYKLWLETRLQEDWWAYVLSTKLVGFSEKTTAALDNVITERGEEGIRDEILADFEVTVPSPDHWTKNEKLSGNMVVDNAFRFYAISAAVDFLIIGAIEGGA